MNLLSDNFPIKFDNALWEIQSHFPKSHLKINPFPHTILRTIQCNIWFWNTSIVKFYANWYYQKFAKGKINLLSKFFEEYKLLLINGAKWLRKIVTISLVNLNWNVLDFSLSRWIIWNWAKRQDSAVNWIVKWLCNFICISFQFSELNIETDIWMRKI